MTVRVSVIQMPVLSIVEEKDLGEVTFDDECYDRHRALTFQGRTTNMSFETPTNKSSKFRLKHSTCKPCINEECNGTLVIGSKFQAEEEILTIVCSNISANCHPPVTLAKFDYECKAKGASRYSLCELNLITNRMHAQDLYRECDREKRRCLDSL